MISRWLELSRAEKQAWEDYKKLVQRDVAFYRKMGHVREMPPSSEVLRLGSLWRELLRQLREIR